MKIFAAGLLLAFTGIVTAATTDPNPPLPRKAPEFVINMQDGKQLLLSSFRGKVIAFAFMHYTCPHCKALCPILSTMQRDYAAKGVQFVGAIIEDGSKENLAEFNKLYVKGGFPVGWAPMPAALEFLKHPDLHYYIPMMAFIDRKGMIVSQYIGDNPFFGDQDKNIRAEVDKILGEKSAATKSFTKTIQLPTKK